MDFDVKSLVGSDVNVPINCRPVVACGDDFACFAHHDDSFRTHADGEFTVCYAVFAFVFVAFVCPCTKL